MSLLVGGARIKEESEQKNILNRSEWRQVFGPQIPIIHTGMGCSMDTHTMILRMIMDNKLVGTLVLRKGMGSRSMEPLWYPRNNHHQMRIFFPWVNLEDKYISCPWVNLAMVIWTHQIMDKFLKEGGKASLILI